MAKFGQNQFGAAADFGGSGSSGSGTSQFGTGTFGTSVFAIPTIPEPPPTDARPGVGLSVARDYAIKPITWVVDYQAMPVGEWQFTSKVNWGYETAEIRVPVEWGLLQPRSEITAYIDAMLPVWEGESIAPPSVDMGIATYQLEGHATNLDHMVDRVLFQSADLSQWVQMSSEPHKYNDNDHISASIDGGKMQFEIPKDGDIAVGNRAGFVFWAQDQEFRSLSFTINIGNNGPQGRLKVYGAHGPSGSLTQIGPDFTVGTPSNQVVRINQDYDLLALVFESTGSSSPLAKRFFWLSNIRVNGVYAADDATTGDVGRVLGGLAGFDTSGVRAGSAEILPLDVTGSHAEAMTNMADIEGWRWLVLNKRGSGPYMEYGPWRKTYLAFLEEGVSPDLDAAPIYDKVVVKYDMFNGVHQVASARPEKDPLPKGHNELLLELTDQYRSNKVPHHYASVSADYYAEYRVEGTIEVYALVDLDTGEAVPVHTLMPGSKLLIADYDPKLPPQRVMSVEATATSVRASLNIVPPLPPRLPPPKRVPPQSVTTKDFKKHSGYHHEKDKSGG